jgi:hypothetical protein
MKMTSKRITADKSGKDKKKDSDRMSIGVYVDTVLWRRLRAMAITNGKLTGELLDAAIQ